MTTTTTPMPREHVVEEVEFLLDTGESPEQIARRLGRKPGTIARALGRAGRNDLARHFYRLDKTARIRATHPCVDCGGVCSREATRCRRCNNRLTARRRYAAS